MDSNVDNARKELDQEFAQVRQDLDKIRLDFDRVFAAGPEDDISQLLEDLEDTIKKVRKGGLVGSGAKGHREAREKYFEAKGKPL